MPLELSLMTEHDFFDFARIKIAAFESGMPHLLIAPPITRDKIQQYADAELHEFRTAPDCRFVKVVDTTAGQSCMVACAKWRINPKERPADVVKHSLPRPTSSDADPAHKAQRDFFGYLAAHRWKHMGTRPFALLAILATDPAHQRRGAGAMLVKWGLARADHAHLPCYIEASLAGRPLYEKLGFRVDSETTFDLVKYGAQGCDVSFIMLRDAS